MSEKKEILVVASKVKAFCKAREMSASAEVLEAATAMIERELAKACDKAKADGRKVVKGRDFEG